MAVTARNWKTKRRKWGYPSQRQGELTPGELETPWALLRGSGGVGVALRMEETQPPPDTLNKAERKRKREIPWHFLSPLHVSPASAFHWLTPMENVISCYQPPRVQTGAGEGREWI